MSCTKFLVMLLLPVAFSTNVSAQSNATDDHAATIDRPQPEFPWSERRRGQEGWVLLELSAGDDGSIVESSVIESSGSSAFNKAAQKAVRAWRFGGAEAVPKDVLFNFVYHRRHPRYSRQFAHRYANAHEAIDQGELEEALGYIRKVRGRRDLTPYELAYSYIAEARVAEVRGDRGEQLQCFRRAMINDGRWVERETYLKLLRATVVLGLQEGDYTSALRDYELLTETGRGRDLAEGLEDSVRQARELLGHDPETRAYSVASLEMSIARDLPRSSIRSGFATDFGGMRDRVPQPEPPRNTQPTNRT